ncbi:MAG: tRNA 2-thiouridine(34) synthase MnmA [Clostridiales bacterium]|nr:tRNA 2-thiouridine(34) synthase MnmA [Clostridiales bacterium]
MSEKVMVAMSGGVDSSVAASLLAEQGYDVCGATLRLFANEDIGLAHVAKTCCSMADVEDAQSVAYRLGIDHFVFNFRDDFMRSVIRRFADAYMAGNTPNPCIDCNTFIKFEKLLERAMTMEKDYIATGHYARITYDDTTGRYQLKKAADASKDQTYVLYALTQEQLGRTLFPLGELNKNQVRALAEARDLVNAKKPDSQDICFVPGGDYAAFIENVLGYKSAPGDFTDSSGKVLGRHKGVIHYTIGQRRGLNMSFDRPKYVISKDAASNTVVIGNEEELYSIAMTVRDLNLISVPSLTEPIAATVKTRYSQKETPATLFPPEDGRMTVLFEKPQRAVTPGQAAVFYDGDTVIGGGTIV